MANEMSPESVRYYSEPGPLTSVPAALHDWLDDVPRSIPALVEAVQNNVIHAFWTQAYGFELPEERKGEVQIRSAAEILRRIHASDPAPLTVARPFDKKLALNCRHFSLLLCTLLRYQGIPARARCGFGAYFLPDFNVDHWVCEYYDAAQGRWIQVDAQLDKVQQDALKIDFDPLDVPRDRFLNGGRAWEMCRQEGADPDKFGIADMKGLWFVRGDLIRDFAALNKMELLPWDCWGLILTLDPDIPEEGYRLLDRVARLCEDGAFDEVRALYDTDERLRVPPVFKSFVGGPEPQDMTLAEAIAH